MLYLLLLTCYHLAFRFVQYIWYEKNNHGNYIGTKCDIKRQSGREIISRNIHTNELEVQIGSIMGMVVKPVSCSECITAKPRLLLLFGHGICGISRTVSVLSRHVSGRLIVCIVKIIAHHRRD